MIFKSVIFSLLNITGKTGKSCFNTGLLPRSYFNNRFDLTFAKGKPKAALCRCYEKSIQNAFSGALQNKISQTNLIFKKFIEMFQSKLEVFAPIKQKNDQI